jgi:hypothetical protein
MVSEHVQRASMILGPLLSRRGTSLAVAVTLRQVGKSLDRALGEADAKLWPHVVRQATSELRYALVLMGKSDLPVDLELRDDAGKALAMLESAEPPATPPATPPAPVKEFVAPPIAPRPMSRPVPPPPATRAMDTHKPTVRPLLSLEFPTVRLRLLGLLQRFRILHAALADAPSSPAAVEAARTELHKHIEAIRWLGEKRMPAFLKAVETAEGLEDQLVAGAALVYLGAPGGIERLTALLARVATENRPEIAGTILRSFTQGAP